jgi:membrane-associated phospholipid phosphatase
MRISNTGNSHGAITRRKVGISGLCLFLLLSMMLSGSLYASDNKEDTTFTTRQFLNSVKTDYHYFYSSDRLIRMSFVFAGGALVANTALDQNIQTWYQDQIRNSRTNNMAKVAKVFGEGKYLIPFSLITALTTTYVVKMPFIGTWGRNMVRSYLVGSPPLVLTQRLTGGSRPGESEEASHWKPLKDDNGVSGHAFVGAVPFLTLAHMNNDKVLLKYLFYTASIFPGLSRINDNMHYPSQVALGWYLAWEATGSVWESNQQEKKLSVVPFIGNDNYYVRVQIEW